MIVTLDKEHKVIDRLTSEYGTKKIIKLVPKIKMALNRLFKTAEDEKQIVTASLSNDNNTAYNGLLNSFATVITTTKELAKTYEADFHLDKFIITLLICPKNTKEIIKVNINSNDLRKLEDADDIPKYVSAHILPDIKPEDIQFILFSQKLVELQQKVEGKSVVSVKYILLGEDDIDVDKAILDKLVYYR